MKATIHADRTERTITLDVYDVPDIDVTTYHRKPRIFRPEIVRIKIVDGDMAWVKVSGGLVKKDGTVSEGVGSDKTWYASDLERFPKDIPDWLYALIKDAPNGVISWG